MYWLFDVALVALFVAVFIDGFSKGISGLFLGIISFFLRFLYTIVVAAAVLMLFEFTGLIDALTVPIAKGLGESSLYPTPILANGLAALVFFLIGLGVAVVTLFFIIRAIRRARIVNGAGPSSSVFGVINRVIGIIVAVGLLCAFVLVIFGFIHGIVACGGFPATDEFLRACPISGLIYKNNPLKAILYDTGIPAMVYNIFHGNFNEIAAAF